MAEKKRKRWNRYSKASQFAPGAGGELAYTGRYFTFQETEVSYRESMRRRIALAAISAVAVLACGCMPVPALTNTWYVLLPYMLTAIAVVSQVWAVCRMSYWGNPLREYVYDTTAKQLPLRTMLAMILSMCTLCGQICHLVLHGLQEKYYIYDFAFLALFIVIFVCSMAWRRMEIRWKWSV